MTDATEHTTIVQTLCAALRSNDPTVTHVDANVLRGGAAREIGEALRGNTIVSELSISQLDETADVRPLLEWIGTSASLKKITIGSLGHVNLQFYEAVARNPNEIDVTAFTHQSYDPLALLLRPPCSIRNLNVHLFNLPLRESNNEWYLPSAFRANVTLEKLEIGSAAGLGVSIILPELATHPVLKELTLRLPEDDSLMDHYREVANVLVSSQSLQTLTVEWNTLNGEAMAVVLDALTSNRILTQLGLTYCNIDDAAMTALITFIQSTANVGTNVLKCLSLEFGLFHSLREAEATMLIGSSLEELMFNSGMNPLDLIAFLRGLVSNASQIRLRRLTLGTINVAEFAVLAEFLRQTARLEHLCILQMNDDIDAATLLSALRQNGSLLAVDIQSGGPTLNESQRRRMLAYGERNRHTPQLLARPTGMSTLSNSTCAADSVNVERTATEESTLEEENAAATKTALEIFPKLYCSAMHAPRTVTNTVLIGLLAADSEVDP